MKLSTEDLQALAEAYGISVSQLVAPPEASDLVSQLDRAQSIIEGMDPATLEHWMALGESLKRK